MRVVIDCNILVMSLTSRSPYHIIYQALVKGVFSLCLTTEILLEYEEVIQGKYGKSTADAFIALLRELQHVHHITTWYNWQLIDADPDDNKYVDCAIAGQAACIVTEDKHFNMLQQVPFPKVTIVSIDAFLKLIC